MKGPNTNERFQIERGMSQNTEQINGQLTVSKLSKKIQLNQITGVLIQDYTKLSQNYQPSHSQHHKQCQARLVNQGRTIVNHQKLQLYLYFMVLLSTIHSPHTKLMISTEITFIEDEALSNLIWNLAIDRRCQVETLQWISMN